ncbi:endolytic transglycosylase MltG [Bacillus sp. FJAT-49732]|uniref:Endolytic murein transglycosylase n=1 Tax=Lederbergia citrisecunda TaxID=2833583 RepID=A0A942YJW0_9BACI|nr:endolytic transglycosylase MltG [Lederbergia citrisecunda]MBS4199758.1 endolytic transglycosylase MltG [Lederbergia citrisecunda]
MRNNLLERRNEARIIRRIVAIITLIVLLVAGGVAFFGYNYIKSSLEPVDPNSNKTTEVDIPIGSSTTSIGKLLEKNGIIKNGTIFKYYVKLNNISGFQAGNYKFSPSMSLNEIAATLKTGKLVREAIFKMTVPEGLQLDQIAKIIAKHTGMSSDEILKKLDDRDMVKQLMKKYPEILTDDIMNDNIKHPLEGYLFPATYSFYEEKPSLESIVGEMLTQTKNVIVKYSGTMEEKEMSVHELITMASLIEKEATQKTDRHNISSVFYNRMTADMPLQTDPTVLYALGKHKDRTLLEDLKVDSPFNTYIHKGLPPGPIANAGETSIEAALNPANTEYLYFLAEYGTGEVHYSKTLQEHNALKEKYITNKRD